jgi:hypothetical protein
MSVLVRAAFVAFALAGFGSDSADAASLPSLREVLVELPQEHFPLISSATGKPYAPADRVKLIKLEDKANAYLELSGSGDTDAFSEGQMTLFKTKAGGYLVGARFEFGDATNQIVMLRKDGSVWKDVTSEVLPKITDEMVNARAKALIPEFKAKNTNLMDSASGTYAYVLPRRGTTIEVAVQSDIYGGPRVVLWRLPFDGAKFTLSDK